MGADISTISTWKDRKSYTATAAQLAEWGLNALTGQGDLEAPANGEIWITNIFNANPPYLLHQYGAAGVMHPKVMEPLAALRVMTGSALNLDAEQMMVEWLVRGLSDEDGLLYSLAEPGRPPTQLAQEVELGASHARGPTDLDLVNRR